MKALLDVIDWTSRHLVSRVCYVFLVAALISGVVFIIYGFIMEVEDRRTKAFTYQVNIDSTLNEYSLALDYAETCIQQIQTASAPKQKICDEAKSRFERVSVSNLWPKEAWQNRLDDDDYLGMRIDLRHYIRSAEQHPRPAQPPEPADLQAYILQAILSPKGILFIAMVSPFLFALPYLYRLVSRRTRSLD